MRRGRSPRARCLPPPPTPGKRSRPFAAAATTREAARPFPPCGGGHRGRVDAACLRLPRYVAFFQDTNVLAFKALPAALGVSERLGFAMNSLTVPRSPGEAAGAICKLVPTAPGLRPLVINVEYNQLDALLQTSASGGDVADATGYSPYPGNVNTLVMKLGPYAQVLTRTRTRTRTRTLSLTLPLGRTRGGEHAELLPLEVQHNP